MRPNSPSKILLVEKLIITWAILATAAYFVQKASVNYTFDYSFFVRPALENRFEGVLTMLPAIGKAFYVPDPEAGPSQEAAQSRGVLWAASQEAALERQLLAKYFLAPYLTTDSGCPYQVTDFSRPVDLQQWAQDHKVDLIRDFQNGVALFKRKAHT